jgi:glycosyltransferase involved in cell wall biosynthesis
MLADAGIMLGVFGDTEKTRYVIPNKVFEALAMGLPLITAESPALNEFLEPGKHLSTVPPGNPTALAAEIVRLAETPSERKRLGEAGVQRIREAFMPAEIGRVFRRIICG